MNTRCCEAGDLTSKCAGLMGRRTRSPPQLGHLKRSCYSVQEAQNVHSNVQMNASAEDGGRSVLQHSQFGLSSTLQKEEAHLLDSLAVEGRRCKRLMRGIAIAPRGKGSARFGSPQRGKIPTRVVLLCGLTRANSLAHFPIRCLTRSRSCKLDALTVCTNAGWTSQEPQTGRPSIFSTRRWSNEVGRFLG